MVDAAITTVPEAPKRDSAVDAPPTITERLWDSETELPEVMRDTPPFGNDVRRATCGKRTSCKVLAEKPAGTDGSGTAISVVVLELPPADMDLHEYWALARKGGAITGRARLAQEYVTTAFLANAFSVKPNELSTSLRWWPTSNWQTFPTRTFQVWPPRMIAYADTPHHRGGAPVWGSRTVGFLDGSGSGHFACGGGRRNQFLPIPSARLSPWLDPSKGLGQCAVVADGSPNHGFVTGGKPDRANGYFRVALLDALYIEVHDDQFTAGDRLEVRTGRPVGFMECDGELAPAVAHTITMDGKVVSSNDAGVRSVMQVGSGTDTRTYRIDYASSGGLTVILHDHDTGSAPRVISTSPLDSIELGEVMGTEALCAKTSDGPALVPTLEK